MRFGLLGPLVVLAEDGGPVPVDGARLRVLLAALLLRAGTAVAGEALADVVWDGAPPPGAARTLRSHVRRLRRLLGPAAGRLVAVGPGYLIRVEPAELDTLEFERLCRAAATGVREQSWQAAADAAARAIGLWRDQPLLDIPSQSLRDSAAPRLERLRVQVLEDHAEAGLRLGRHEQLLASLHEAVAAYPLRERFRGQLMLALYRSGRRAEALTAYQHARTALADELGIEPGPDLRRLHERLLAGDGELAGPATASAATPKAGPATVPRQLPAAARHFTGRQRELDRIVSLAGSSSAQDIPGTVAIAAIDGMAGIGKTALAVHAAHRLAAGFPDGQLFIDLRGHTLGQRPLTAEQALGSLLRALGVPPAQIPGDGEEAAALYRQRLAGARTLIVLDNAASEAQVRPLLPGGGACLVLITSRRRLKGLDDADALSLDVLPAADAGALLRAVAGAGHRASDGPLLAEVAELCGYLPLALRIAASLLRHRPAWSPEHLAGLLRGHHQRVLALSDGDRDLSAVFDLSYASIDGQRQRLWRRLGVIPGPDLDAYAAAALDGLDPAAAARSLQDLVDHNLLAEHSPGRYRLHDLLRAHARALSAADGADEREAALDRLLRYYAHTAQTASAPVSRYPRLPPDGPAPAHAPALADQDAARAWLRTERLNLTAAFTHAREHGLGPHAVALAAGLAEILQTDGPFAHAIAIHEAAAETAGRLGRLADHANALIDLGRLRRVTGDYAAADDALASALTIHRSLGNRFGQALALNDLGRLRQLTGAYPGADDALAGALQIYRALGNPLGAATTLNELGRVRYMTGDYRGAGDALSSALDAYREIGNRLGEATALNDLGRVRELTGDHPAADDACSRALLIYRELGNGLGEATALGDLGRVRGATGDHLAAADAQHQALLIFRELGNRLGEAHTLAGLGRTRQLTGDHRGADEALTRALEIYRLLGDRNSEAWALNSYAAALAAAGLRSPALEAYQRALAMNRELGKLDDEAVSLEGIGECRLADGDAAEGGALLAQALAIYRRLGMLDDAARIRGRLAALDPAAP